MKKLLVTAIGAAAAFGAVAGTISSQRFESASEGAKDIAALNTLAEGTYWAGDELTNTYTVVSADGETFPQDKPLGTPTKALAVKTVFGNPLKLDAISGGSSTNIPASGIYFDSLVKFTVCEDAPDQAYQDAKIIMWLQEKYVGDTDTVAGTNIMVRANYINADGTFTTTNFTCYSFNGDIDEWYRVTIKTWADITNGDGIPGFAIFINGTVVNVASGATMADAFVGNLTEAAYHLGKESVFASLVQGNAAGKSTITSASFDGTGTLTDLVFTDAAPFDAAEDYVEPKAVVTIDDQPVSGITTLADAVAAVNGAAANASVAFALRKGMEISEPLVFASAASVTFDFAGCVLTNEAAYCAITNTSGAITFIDSASGGGITCTDPTAGAIYVDSTADGVTIQGGIFRSTVTAVQWGSLLVAKKVYISGGSFEVIEGLKASDGKKFELNQTTGLYDVVNKANYTVKFISGEGSYTNEYTQLEGTTVAVPAAQEIVGKTFSAWSPAIAGETVTFEADATYTAVYTVNTYTVTFVDAHGAGGTVNDVAYGTVLSTIAPEIGSLAGYTAAWDASLDGTVTDNITVTAVYTGKTFTINTYVIGTVGVNATTNFTYAGESVNPAAPSFDTDAKEWNGAWYTDSKKTAAFEFSPAGADVQSAYVELTDKGGSVPDIPAGGETDCGTAEAATAAAAAINTDAASKAAHIEKPSTVGEGDAATTYYSYVEAKAVGTKVTVDFTTAGEAAAQTSANTDVVALPVAAAAAANTKATVGTVAGFYYSIVSGTTPTTVTTEGTRVLGTGSTIELDVPNKGSAGFYKVKVSATAK